MPNIRKSLRESRLRRWLLLIAAVITVFFAWLVFSPAPEGILILEYHMVSTTDDEDSRPYNVPPDEFRQHLDYLREQGYTAITLQDFMRARKGKQELPAKPVILTFDDGYEDNYTTLLPILEEYGIRANVFMVTNMIGREGYLTWDELRDMQNRGIEIGSHTADHLPLPNLPADVQEKEVHLSKLLLEWNGIKTVFHFSYPNGAYTKELPGLLHDTEYLSGVTGDAGINTMETDPYLLQRVNIPHPHFGLTEFKLRLWKAEILTKMDWKQHRIDPSQPPPPQE